MMYEPSEPQAPGEGQIYLDHVGWFVPDMDAAAAAFRRLGFPMSPFTVHTNEQPDGTRVPSGTANRCAMIARGYLEVLTDVPDVDTPLSSQLRGGLARYTGLHLIAFTVSDAEAATARLREAGFDPEPPVALRRAMPLDGGGEGTAAFSVVRLPPGAMAEGRIQILTQDTPDVVWQPSVTAHENGLDMLSGVLICTTDPEEAAGRYGRFTGKPVTPAPQGVRRVLLDRGEIAFCDRDCCGEILPGVVVPDVPFIAAVAIRSVDLSETRAWFARNDIALLADGAGRLVVSPSEMCGAALVAHDGEMRPFGIA
ncbi:MAG: VOC family protein [Rhodospirillaceae bacterium]